MTSDRPSWPTTLVVAVGALFPLVVCLVLSTVRDTMANTNVALVLVLVVVAAASSGSRAAGLCAAVVSAAGFDVFLTQPYGTFAIHSAADLQTTILLLLIGIAVTELALWGRRQQARASAQEGYLDGLLQTTAVLAEGAPPATVIEHVETQLTDLLDLDETRYVPRPLANAPVLGADGNLTKHGHVVEVDRAGWPTDTEVFLPIGDPDDQLGGFRLVAAVHVARPNRRERQVAVLLADQVATAMRHRPGHVGEASQR